MLFRITTRRNDQTTVSEVAEVKQAADAIENWQSRFTDRPRTRYGMKMTSQYVEALTLKEVGRFNQPIVGPMREQFVIERVA